MKTIYWIGGTVALIGVAALVALSSSNSTPASTLSTERTISEKVYIALEGEGKVAVLNAADNRILKTIDLSDSANGGTVRYMAHNVQVAPDGKSVLVTANVEEGMDMEDSETQGMQMSHGEAFDQLVVIDPSRDEIARRITIDTDSHLAHVVIAPDSRTAYVTLQEKGKVYSVDLTTGSIANKVDLGKKSGPHGLRLTPDGSEAYIALLDGKGVDVLDTRSGSVRKIKLPGAGVQAAVTPDGTFVLASVYNTKQVFWLNRQTGEQGLINLPSGSKGPVQLYPTPDSQYLYVADQGYYFDQPTGNVVYRINIADKVVDQTISGGSAPHGVVVSHDGARVFVTNLLSDDVSVIDTATGKEIARVPVGDMPNGISIWNAQTGGTP
ncbi:YncE family protein [Patescibacteria group bacterium]|nr:YncE family protein [Patescibacteria group bacterium]